MPFYNVEMSRSSTKEISQLKIYRARSCPQDERDALGRRIMLSDCEVRGDAQVGGRLSAFAKRAKKLPISCTFQWIRVKEGVRNH